MSAADSRLAIELDLYDLRKNEWLKHHCEEYVVIKNTEVLGFYPEFKDAYTAGVRKWGVTDFLVKQVLANDPVFWVFGTGQEVSSAYAKTYEIEN